MIIMSITTHRSLSSGVSVESQTATRGMLIEAKEALLKMLRGGAMPLLRSLKRFSRRNFWKSTCGGRGMDTHTYIHTYIHTYTHTYIHPDTHIHACIHTYTRTCIHTYTHIQTSGV
jgi:hypothetical protein